eukprot:15396128-Alexandrium_andersonii.AAC.1
MDARAAVAVAPQLGSPAHASVDAADLFEGRAYVCWACISAHPATACRDHPLCGHGLQTPEQP